MDDRVKNWLKSAEYDLETAVFMFKSKRFIYTIFFCHLVLEKILKAKIQQVSGKTPPKTHDLLYLLRLSGLSPAKEISEFLSRISDLSVPTRYPENFTQLLRTFDEEMQGTIWKRLRRFSSG